jgi:hypothetical protein
VPLEEEEEEYVYISVIRKA